MSQSLHPKAPPESIGQLLAQVSRLHHSQAHALLDEIGLHRGQPFILRLLWEQDGLAQSDLARRMHVRPATITNMVKRMERAGLVERRPDERDRRVSRVYLTEAGRSIREQVQRVWRDLEAQTFAGLNDEERQLFYQFLLHVRENLMEIWK